MSQLVQEKHLYKLLVMKKQYKLVILDGTSRGYSEQIEVTGLEISGGIYHFYNIVDSKRIEVAKYPINRTIIHEIKRL